jgi:hypothetical protein
VRITFNVEKAYTLISSGSNNIESSQQTRTTRTSSVKERWVFAKFLRITLHVEWRSDKLCNTNTTDVPFPSDRYIFYSMQTWVCVVSRGQLASLSQCKHNVIVTHYYKRVGKFPLAQSGRVPVVYRQTIGGSIPLGPSAARYSIFYSPQTKEIFWHDMATSLCEMSSNPADKVWIFFWFFSQIIVQPEAKARR